MSFINLELCNGGQHVFDSWTFYCAVKCNLSALGPVRKRLSWPTKSKS